MNTTSDAEQWRLRSPPPRRGDLGHMAALTDEQGGDDECGRRAVDVQQGGDDDVADDAAQARGHHGYGDTGGPAVTDRGLQIHTGTPYGLMLDPRRLSLTVGGSGRSP